MRRVNSWACHLFLLGATAVSATAAPVVVPTNLGPTNSSFTATLGVSGTVTGSATGTALGIFPINVPSQSHNIVLTSNPAVVSTPIGTSNLGFDDVDLGNRSLESTFVDISNGASVPFSFQQVVFTGTLGGGALTVTANINGSLQDVTFTQSVGPQPADPAFTLPGVVSARVLATIDAVASSGFLNIPFTEQIDTVASGEYSLTGDFDLTDLDPSGPYPHDVLASLSGDTELLFPIQDDGEFTFNESGVNVTGAFALDLLVSLSDISYNLESVIADIVFPAGDANHDGLVNGADFTVWADNFGSGPGSTVFQGDFNNDGFVNGADFTVWADNFGAGAPAATVPEPGAWALGLLAVVGASVIGSRRARR